MFDEKRGRLFDEPPERIGRSGPQVLQNTSVRRFLRSQRPQIPSPRDGGPGVLLRDPTHVEATELRPKTDPAGMRHPFFAEVADSSWGETVVGSRIGPNKTQQEADLRDFLPTQKLLASAFKGRPRHPESPGVWGVETR